MNSIVSSNNNLTSIVILSYNTLDYLKLCIESIRLFTQKGTYEIIVIENGSRDGSSEWLRKQLDIKCIFNKENKGFPKGCNQGMTIARGSEILLLNSDVIVTPRWLEQMKRALYSDNNVGAVSCVTNNCSNLQKIEVNYNNIDELIYFADKYNHSDQNKWLSYYVLVGFCFLMRKSVYEEIGEMDEEFTPGNYEDDDYSFRIRLAGYKLFVCHDTYIHHFGSGSFIKKRNSDEYKIYIEKYQALLSRNKEYFCKKWNVPNYYRISNIPCDQLIELMQPNTDVLLIGSYCMTEYLHLLYLNNMNVQIDYITDSEIEKILMHNELTIIYTDNILNTINDLNKRYDMIIVSNKLSYMYNRDSLCKLLKKISKTGQIIIQNKQ